jgi:hypothetical protein
MENNPYILCSSIKHLQIICLPESIWLQEKNAIDERLTADLLGMGKSLSGQWRG